MIRLVAAAAVAFSALAATPALAQQNLPPLRNVDSIKMCNDQLESFYRRIADRLQNWKDRGFDGFNAVWRQRQEYETARYIMTNGEQGFRPAGGRPCAPVLRKHADWPKMEARFKEVEAMVVEMEEAKEVKFVAVTPDAWWADAKTNEPVAKPDER